MMALLFSALVLGDIPPTLQPALRSVVEAQAKPAQPIFRLASEGGQQGRTPGANVLVELKGNVRAALTSRNCKRWGLTVDDVLNAGYRDMRSCGFTISDVQEARGMTATLTDYGFSDDEVRRDALEKLANASRTFESTQQLHATSATSLPSDSDSDSADTVLRESAPAGVQWNLHRAFPELFEEDPEPAEHGYRETKSDTLQRLQDSYYREHRIPRPSYLEKRPSHHQDPLSGSAAMKKFQHDRLKDSIADRHGAGITDNHSGQDKQHTHQHHQQHHSSFEDSERPPNDYNHHYQPGVKSGIPHTKFQQEARRASILHKHAGGITDHHGVQDKQHTHQHHLGRSRDLEKQPNHHHLHHP